MTTNKKEMKFGDTIPTLASWIYNNLTNSIQTRGTVQILINGSNGYINFGATVGSTGYGIRDNAGIMEVKNIAGAWASIGTGTATGDVVGPAGATGDDVAVFDGATGKLIKDGGKKVADFELVANKDATITLGTSDTKYPTQKAVKTYADNILITADNDAFFFALILG